MSKGFTEMTHVSKCTVILVVVPSAQNHGQVSKCTLVQSIEGGQSRLMMVGWMK